jgi:hypothetical protein
MGTIMPKKATIIIIKSNGPNLVYNTLFLRNRNIVEEEYAIARRDCAVGNFSLFTTRNFAKSKVTLGGKSCYRAM